MTTLELYRKHKAGEVSREKFLYEVRRDNNLPFITNLTSYDDAVKILKNKGIVTEVDTKEAKADEAVKAEVKAKAPSTKKPKELHIDHANPYEYRHGLQYELEQLDDYSDEALEKAKSTVLKNLAKDANFYSNLLNAKQSPFTFKATETDAKGMQANADGHLKKEAKKDEKANVQDSLGKKEAGKKKPKGIKIMPDKGVTGSEKTIKEGFEVNQDDDQIEISDDSGDYVGFVEDGKVSFSVVYDDTTSIEDKFGEEGITKNNWKDVLGPKHAFVKIIDTIGGDVEALDDYVQITVDADKLLNSNIKEKDKVDLYPGNMGDEMSAPTSMEEDLPGMAGGMHGGEDFRKAMGIEDDSPYEDDNFPFGTKIQAMLDKVADEWGKDSDVYNDLEDAIVGWSDRNGELSPKGKIAIRALLSNWDILDDYEQFLSEDLEEANPNYSPEIGSTAYNSAEDQFNQLMSKYDWYYEMSDDHREWERGNALDKQLKALGKQIGVDKAVALFNDKAPSDRKVTSSFFMEGEDKHAKIKEALKKALKEEDPQLTITNKAIEKKEQELAALRIQQGNVLKKPGTQS